MTENESATPENTFNPKAIGSRLFNQPISDEKNTYDKRPYFYGIRSFTIGVKETKSPLHVQQLGHPILSIQSNSPTILEHMWPCSAVQPLFIFNRTLADAYVQKNIPPSWEGPTGIMRHQDEKVNKGGIEFSDFTDENHVFSLWDEKPETEYFKLISLRL